ncbi:hypothetical protein MASR1M36_08450 [Candidatus Cloacimonadaceae bacterium]
MKRMFLVMILLLLLGLGLQAELVQLGSGENTLSVLSSSESETVMQFNINQFEKQQIEINGSAWYQIRLPKEGITQDKGFPELPVFNRSIIISNSARMKLEVFDLQYQDFSLNVAPSKGVITRDINPASVPYTFDNVYLSSGFYPEQMAGLSMPYILRDFRGITIKTTPFAYNPEKQLLRVYTSYKVRVYAEGTDTQNVLLSGKPAASKDFLPIYENHFVNWQSYRYTPVSDSFGKLLVICHTNFLTQIAPYVNWKKQKGIQTELVEFSTIGTTAAQLQTYIQNRYNADNTITFVQLVGDAPQIPSLSSGGGGSDPSFSLVAGSDMYPDIFIGRFSGTTATEISAQVNKAIVYERDLNTSATWLSQAMGIASAEGGGSQGDNGESDITHMNNIRTDLLGYGYTSVDQVYDPGAAASTVTTNVNAGRGFINYVGHGSDTSWVTTGFSNTNASALTNGNKTPFIMDVACVNGNFVSMTCFAEAWMRNANGGSVAIYASSINQSWNSPMRAQDECTDLLIAQSKTTTGGLYYNSSCKMMDIYGNTSGSDGVNMFKTWHIFGDAALTVRTKTPLAMTVTHPATILIGATSVSVNTGVSGAVVALTYNNTIYGVATANSSGVASVSLINPPASAITYTVTATAFNRVSYVGSIQQVAGSGPYMSVETANYADSNNNVADYNESGRFNVTYKNIGPASATNVSTTLSCSTAGITITDNSESITSLASNASTTINNAYSFNIANNVANGTQANFTITMVSGSETWTHNFSLTLNAPALAFGSYTVNDASGNNNGRLDPGETAILNIPLANSGSATSPTGTATLSSPTSGITITAGTQNFAAIAAGGSTNLSFSVSVASTVSVGTVAGLNFGATASAYNASKNDTATIGLILEDFESGTFSAFPWTLAGAANWTVANTEAYAGTYCAKSGLITHSQSSTIETTRVLSSSGTLSFWYRVSSESTYDYLKFYIDGVLQNSWSGTVAWTQASYTLNAGTRILKWEYMKDGSVSSGSDCAWLDNIIFPASTAPSTFNPPQNLIAAPGNGVVNLSWQAPNTGTPTGYKIFKNSSLLTTVSGLNYSDSAVTNGSTYSYYLKAVYSGGESDPTATVNATPGIITEAIIGSGTSSTGTSEASPINIYYESLHGQAVYTAAELSSAGLSANTSITQVGFYVSSIPSLALPNFVIRMKHTTDTNVANWQAATGMTTVYSSSSYMPVAGGYHMLTLSTPFVWNGTSNIVVDTAFGVLSSWTSSGTVQYTTTTSGYRYIRDDDVDQTGIFTGGSTTTYRPNLKLSFQPAQTEYANISANPSSVTQTAITGESASTQITLSNTGNIALTWSSTDREEELRNSGLLSANPEAARTGWLSYSPSSGTIPAGGSTVINLSLSSSGLAIGSYNKNITITSNASNSPTYSIPVSFTVQANPYPAGPRFVAEWEPATGVLIAYSSGFGIPYSAISDMSTRGKVYVVVTTGSQSTANSALTSNGVTMSNVIYVNPAGVNSYWTRDYGPWTIMDSNNQMAIVDFRYNRVRPYDDVLNELLDDTLGVGFYYMPLVATGGNVMTDGNGKMMSTNLVLTENDGVQNSQVTEYSYTQAQINSVVSNYLGATEYQFYTDPLANSSIDHIDCFAKLLDVDKVIIARVPSSHTNYAALEAVVAAWQSKTSSYGTPYQIFRVDQSSNNEPYTNSFIYNNKIYVPQWNSTPSSYDTAAIAAYQAAMPGYQVQGYYNSSWLSDDSMHCRVNTIFDKQMIHTRFVPPTSAQALSTVAINAQITHVNPLTTAGTFVAYKHSAGGAWQYVSMSNSSGNTWTANVPTPALGQTLYYYIKATDTTARTYYTPLCNSSDPFKLIVNIPAPNLAPTISLPESLSFDKNGSLNHSFAAYLSDPNGDPLTLSVSGNLNIELQINGTQVNFSAENNWTGSEILSFTVSDGQLNASDTILITVNPVNVPSWEPISYGNPPAMLHALLTVDNQPCAVNDMVAAFVGTECRGTGVVNSIGRLNAYAYFTVNLAANETVSFKIYSYENDEVYPVQEILPMQPGTVYGEGAPVALNGTTNLVLAAPSASLQNLAGSTRLAWDAVPHAESYTILASTDPYTGFSPLGNTSNLYWDINPNASKMFYKVIAVRNQATK